MLNKILLLFTCLISATVTQAADVTVFQGYQTTGQGNRNSVLLKIKMPKDSVFIRTMNVTLKGNTLKNIEGIKVYQSTFNDFPADPHPQCLAAIKPKGNRLQLKLKASKTNKPAFLFLTADVCKNATQGDSLDAKITSMVINGHLTPVEGDPVYAQKIFKTQRFLGVPDTYGSHYYRIPAMVVAHDGSIVTAFDKRFNNLGDAGSHRIDLVVRRSIDNGCTWTEPLTIAQGQGQGTFDFGFGDPALVVTKSGRIICLSCAGNKNFWDGQADVAMMYSDDNGKTWTQPTDLVHQLLDNQVDTMTNALRPYGFFVTSGRGICTTDGTIMFACNYKNGEGVIREFIMYSKDEGKHWTLDGNLAYLRADESKLLQMNDGRIMVSVRQKGARGFNMTKTKELDWGQQWRNGMLSGAACNADILYYSRETEGKEDIILHTIPLTIPSLQRANLCLFASKDAGKTWKNICQLQAGAASYSTMDRLPDGSLAIFYEDESNGVDNWTMNYILIDSKSLLKMFQ